MPITRTIPASPDQPLITDVTYTPDNTEYRSVIAMTPDRSTLYVVSQKDDTTAKRLYTATSATASGTLVATFPDKIEGMWFTDDGEALVSTNGTMSMNGLYKSTGLSKGAAATWRKVLTVGGTSPGVNVKSQWGLSKAPAGHVRSGLVVCSEYGSQSNASTPLTGGAGRVWLSLDHGATWREIWNLIERFGTRNHHMHGVCYDPFSDAIFMSFGDGYAGDPAKSGIAWTTEWDKPKADITWNWVVGPVSSATFQVTSMVATDAGIIALADGNPDGIQMIPRLPDGSGYGPIFSLMRQENNALIGHCARRWADGEPIFLTFYTGTSNQRRAKIHATLDGFDVWTVYADTATNGSTTGIYTVVGPDRSGLVHWTQYQDTRGAHVCCAGELTWGAPA